MPRRPFLACAAVLAASALAFPAAADGTPLKANLVESKSIKLDGVPKEWDGFQSLSYSLKGKAAKPDLEARGAIAYDSNNIYIAADVTDDVLKSGGDRVELVIGFPGGATQNVSLYPGEPGKTAGSAKNQDGTPVSGAKVIEAPHQGGWSIEASIPWSTFPQARLVRVGLRGALFLHDVDSGTIAKNVAGSAPFSGYAALPALVTETEQALADGLLRDKNIKTAPRHNITADVAGDTMKERVLVFDRYLVVLGSSFRKGTEYYYSDLGVDPTAGMLPSFEVRDVTGDGQSEIIMRKRFGSGNRFREMIQIMSFGSADVPNTIFRHEIGISSETGSIANEVNFVNEGGKIAIKITPGQAKGFNAGNYNEATESGFDSLLLPWGVVASQTYKYSGGGFSKANEEKQSAAAAPPREEPAALPKAAPPSPGELQEKVYDMYKHDRGASGRPRFDLAADVSADKQVERILIHDRDVVIFGKGYKGGTGYTFLTLTQFASPSDIIDLTAKDLTADGKAEIIIKGVMHAAAPKEAGGGTVDREVVIVFQMQGDVLKRVFAAETGRSMGKKRVSGSLQFLNGSKGMDIEIAPGKATEWTDKTYPFNQDNGAVGGFEPLLLPWSGARAMRYRWNGTAFIR